MRVKDTPPFAPVLMESTRAMGYSLEAAVADIIDNSIAASAGEVDVYFSPYDAVPYVAILDDGTGMSSDQIDDAMRYGSQSSLNIRGEQDLGRFGLGLKTASLSQCRCLTVISKQGRKVVARRWDLDEIYSLVRDVEDLLGEDQDALSTFRVRLVLNGYDESDEKADELFHLHGYEKYRVYDDFPRIRKSKLTSEINNGDYTLSIAALAPWQI